MKLWLLILFPICCSAQIKQWQFSPNYSWTEKESQLGLDLVFEVNNIFIGLHYSYVNHDFKNLHAEGGIFTEKIYKVLPIDLSQNLSFLVGKQIDHEVFNFAAYIGPSLIGYTRRGNFIKTKRVCTGWGGFFGSGDCYSQNIYERKSGYEGGIIFMTSMKFRIFKPILIVVTYTNTQSGHMSDHSVYVGMSLVFNCRG